MITSMTGYAAATRDLPTASLAAELKSVNGRFLDVQFRLPDELRTVEPALRELIQARVGRGKVECRVAVTPPTGAALREADPAVRPAVAAAVRAALAPFHTPAGVRMPSAAWVVAGMSVAP